MAAMRGRPSKGDQAKRSAIAVRTSNVIKDRISRAALENDRSITQQVEQIIEAWFALETEFGGPKNMALFKSMAQALSLVETKIGDWQVNLEAFVAARDSISRVMDSLAPPLPPEITELFSDAQQARDKAREEKDALFPQLLAIVGGKFGSKQTDTALADQAAGCPVPYTPILDDDLSDPQVDAAILSLDLSDEHAVLLRKYHQAKRNERIGSTVMDQAVNRARRFEAAARQRASFAIRDALRQGNG